MAARLARLGPHEGPSAALDARILAAAHAAAGPGAAPRHRGMRRVLALPAGWLTGAGLAASMALVLGVVWQLQPPRAVVAERGEAPVADGGFVPAQPVPSGRPRVLAPAAPPAESTEVAPAAEGRAEPQMRKRAATAPAPQRDLADAGSDRSTDAVSEMPAAVADTAAPPAPPPPAAAVAAAPAAAAESDATSQESGQEALTRAPERRHSYTNSARAASAAMAESRALRQAAARDSGRESAAMASAAAAPSADGLTADHAPSEWFAEVRRLRDGGEVNAARALLERFVEAHPSQALPDDLRPLQPAPPPVP
ncbi:MAG: hypothetical protein A2190_13030 [Lysobacterales bacterium RIFOXYA1_FULL_69_10]|nr:MAG: hypothetical protein A2190_13030 [Xanthomonadales bacterium RIFOXYA1_FULL_69_10]